MTLRAVAEWVVQVIIVVGVVTIWTWAIVAR